MRVIKADIVSLNLVAWNNIIGPISYFVGLREHSVMIDRGSWGC